MRSYTNCKALVVDDNQISRSIIEELLGNLDIACITADSGEKALEILTNNEPDVIFVSHVMPGMDGLELCRRIRAKGGVFTGTPVVILTGNEVTKYKEEYSEAGVSGWLTTPFDASELEAFLPLKNTVIPQGVSMRVVKAFIEDTLEVIPEMDRFLASGDLKHYSVEVHSLKSNLRYLESHELSELARELEELSDEGKLEKIKEKHPYFARRVTEFVRNIVIPVSGENVKKRESRRLILAIDDSPVNLHRLKDILGRDYNIHTERTGVAALEYLKSNLPDIILLDIKMPDMNGYDVMKALKGDPRLAAIPVIFLTGSEHAEDEERAFDEGAVDFIKKPIQPAIIKARIKQHLELELYRKNLEKTVSERTKRLAQTEDAILGLLANVTSYRDEETGTHILRTTDYVKFLVKLIQENNPPGYYISAAYGETIITSAKLHDIGKVAISDMILLKPGKLTPEEFDEMKKHTVAGAQMITDAIRDLNDDSYLRVAHEIIIAHHEKWNGTGYPHGLKGEEIPISARIMAIADVYDALISERPYKKPLPHEKAVEILLADSGAHFDPVIIELTRDHFDVFDQIAQKHKVED